MEKLSLINLDNIPWKIIICKKVEVRLDISLNCGQSFRWKSYKEDQWIGVMQNCVWILTQDDENIKYKVIPSHDSNHPDDRRNKTIENHDEYFENLLRDYFRMDLNLCDLSKHWCEVDEHFTRLFDHIEGVRVLRQDPVETLFAFICSSNNNITRITSMVENLCTHFGELIAEIDGRPYFAFPVVSKLAEDSVCEVLKSLRFGYQAKFINEAAKYLVNNFDAEYLFDLRVKPYADAKKDLVRIPGVGAKVADCICLMSLDKLDTVPVDTHVLQIAERDYKIKINTKSLTDSSYNKIANFFKNLWGPYAGWAQSVAFSADLKKFQPIIKKGKASHKK